MKQSSQGSFNKEPTPPPQGESGPLLNGTIDALEKMKISYKLEDFEIKSTLGESQSAPCMLSSYPALSFILNHIPYSAPSLHLTLHWTLMCMLSN